MPIIHDVVAQHAEEAAFLWLLRDRAVGEPHYRLKDLAKLDGRVEAHLDGLRVAGDEGWALLLAELKWEEPGEIFAAGVLALESGREERIARVLEVARPEAALRRAFASALGWSPTKVAEPWIRRAWADAAGELRHVAISAAAIRRLDPGPQLETLARDPDPLVRARALRAAGELGRADLLALLAYQSGDDDHACRFWATWSHGVLGATAETVKLLLGIAEGGGRFAARAAHLGLRLLKPDQGGPVWRAWAKKPERRRLALQAAGWAGDPAGVPELFAPMDDPLLARVAGEAFCAITGADLAHEDLDRKPPEEPPAGPTENPEDADVALDPDENLRWPDPERCRGWWSARAAKLPAGQRHLAGRPVRSASLRQVLAEGFQRQRLAAALELSIRNPGQPIFECRARGFRQRRELAG